MSYQRRWQDTTRDNYEINMLCVCVCLCLCFKILAGDPLLQHFYELQITSCVPQIRLKFKFLGSPEFRGSVTGQLVPNVLRPILRVETRESNYAMTLRHITLELITRLETEKYTYLVIF